MTPYGGAAPDYVEPLEAWRVWRVKDEPEGPRLHSVVQDTLWPAREELVASCLRRRVFPRVRRSAEHPAPVDSCACGIYATSLDGLDSYLNETLWHRVPPVFGRVLLWGRVIECERGWRAARAYPAQIFVPLDRHGRDAEPSAPELAAALGAYGVPVEVLPGTARRALAVARSLEREAVP